MLHCKLNLSCSFIYETQPYEFFDQHELFNSDHITGLMTRKQLIYLKSGFDTIH